MPVRCTVVHLRPTCVVGAGHGLGEELLPCWVLLECFEQRLAMSLQERDLARLDCVWQVVPGHVPHIMQCQYLQEVEIEATGGFWGSCQVILAF